MLVAFSSRRCQIPAQSTDSEHCGKKEQGGDATVLGEEQEPFLRARLRHICFSCTPEEGGTTLSSQSVMIIEFLRSDIGITSTVSAMQSFLNEQVDHTLSRNALRLPAAAACIPLVLYWISLPRTACRDADSPHIDLHGLPIALTESLPS
jgi:hypothetical protein